MKRLSNLFLLGILLLLLSCAQRDNPFDPKSPFYIQVPQKLELSMSFDSLSFKSVQGDTIYAVNPLQLHIVGSSTDPRNSEIKYPIQYSHLYLGKEIRNDTNISEIKETLTDTGLHILTFSSVNYDKIETEKRYFFHISNTLNRIIRKFDCSVDSLPALEHIYEYIYCELIDSQMIVDSIFYVSQTQITKKDISKCSFSNRFTIKDTLFKTFYAPIASNQKVTLFVKSKDGKLIDSSIQTIRFFNQVRNRGLKPIIDSIIISPNPSTVGDSVNFTVRANDPDGRICKIEWNFGDGYMSRTETPQHRYQNSGSFIVQCKIFDDSGLTAIDSQLIMIKPTPNKPPVIKTFNVRPNEGAAPLYAYFSATAYDYEGEVLNYLWNFGDGEQNITDESRINHTYTKSGVYPVQLIVRDPSGSADTVQDTVVVTHIQPLIYGIFLQPNPAVVNDTIRIWVVHTDHYNAEYTYTWYIENDTIITNTNKIYHVFNRAGEHLVKVVVNSPGNQPVDFVALFGVIPPRSSQAGVQ